MSLESRLSRIEGKQAGRRGKPPPNRPGMPPPLEIPNIIEFVTGAAFLNQRIFPRQATLLKLIFCALDLLTDYDLKVIREWAAGFELAEQNDGSWGYTGSYGVVPDVLQRVEYCRSIGRKYFREVVIVGGRRGSKSWIGAVSAAYILFQLLAIPDPQEHFGIAPGKQLHVQVFAGQHDQAISNQFKDLVDMICKAPCFQPFVAKVDRDRLYLYSAGQCATGNVEPGDAAFVITARPSTQLAGRGPTVVINLFDEMAHLVPGGRATTAEELFSAATPALAQFGTESFCLEASSPWQKQGQFFASYRRGLAVDPETKQSLDRDMLVAQLPSEALYIDWEKTQTGQVSAWPGGPPLPKLTRVIFDAADADRLRREDPAGYDVEYGAQWGVSLAPFLTDIEVDALFAPWKDEPLAIRSHGALGIHYIAHADPSVSRANFAVMVAHREKDADKRAHVVVDYVHVWRPSDFPDGQIDYDQVTNELWALMKKFRLMDLTFDQFQSAGLLGGLRARARAEGLEVNVSERTATASANRKMADTLKMGLRRGLIHAPYIELLDAELRSLETRNGKVEHPTRGPVQTSDLADCLMNLAQILIGDDSGSTVGDDLGAVTVSGSRPAHPLDEAFTGVHRGAAKSPRLSPARGRHYGRGNRR